MDYKEVADVYEQLEGTSSGLKKTDLLADFLKKIKQEPEIIYLLEGRVFPDYDKRELGISQKLAVKAISTATGDSQDAVTTEFKKIGDLGKVAENLIKEKKQSSLFSGKLTTSKVINNLRKVAEIEGKGTISKKIGLIADLLHAAKPKEARYIMRTVLGDLKIGVGSGLLRDAIVSACFNPEKENKKEKTEQVQQAYDQAADFALVFEKACKNKLEDISLSPGRPVKVMLFPKAKDIDDAFKRVGKPAAFEFKYDGFRIMINKKGKEIKIFTRRLENVTNQFPDIVEAVKKHVKAKDYILDAEVVGYEPSSKEYKPFQAISQRIKRKYDINKLVKELPVEVNIFDILYCNGKSFINEPFKDRRKKIEKIVKKKKYEVVLAEQIITSSKDKAEAFYKRAIEEGQEGLMVKGLDKPYKPGSRVGYGMKLKPEDKDFDLVITGAEYGTGKRAGWLTSYDVSCRDTKSGNLLEVGKVSTGLKEKREQGLSFTELTDKLKKIIEKEKGRHVEVKPEIVVTVQYQNVQKSPTYSSGYALRFPRIVRERPDRNKSDIATLKEIKKEAE
ncbi:MAG: ATP-dependent DNA ligase [Candidatus Nanoarchaeia archaeon]